MSTDSNGASAPKTHRSPFENWISLSGTIVAAGSFFAFVFLFAIQALTGDRNQYLGILTFVVAPLFLITGLLAILVGWLVHRRRLARTDPDAPRALLTVDLSRPRDRRNFALFLSGAFLFLLLTAFGSYETFHYSESVEFCGTLCHTVMEPEYVAYQRGEHARVACVQCHVGGGAGYYLKSKINGAYQLYSLAFDKYNRPIPTPIHGLRPAQDTCEKCHWPERFTGSLERRYEHLLSDKDNTPYSIRLLLDVGGANAAHGPIGGIHWHMSKEHKVEYYADDAQRQNILWVRTTLPDGTGRTYRKGDFKDDPPAAHIRTMDCVDCHTRPAHNFRAPNDALERAIKTSALDLAGLPLFKRHAVAALTAEYVTVAEAETKIAEVLREKYPDTKTDAAIALVQNVYRENFFPLMKTSWKAYPDNIGHKNWPGCFRCHNDELLAGAYKPRITQNDCNSCHVILAQGRGAQLHQLAPDGYEFVHPDGEVSGMYCSDCHNGANQ